MQKKECNRKDALFFDNYFDRLKVSQALAFLPVLLRRMSVR